MIIQKYKYSIFMLLISFMFLNVIFNPSISNNLYAKETVDYSYLNEVFSSAPFCTNMDKRYSEYSWSVYEPILMQANQILNEKNVTQNIVDEVAKNLQIAKDNLIKISNLKKQLEKATVLLNKQECYSQATWNVFINLYNQSNIDIVDIEITQQQIDTDCDSIDKAMGNLLNVEYYHQILSKMPDISQKPFYSNKSWEDMIYRYDICQDIVLRLDIKQENFDNMVYGFYASINGLQKLASRQVISQKLDELNTFSPNDYTKNSFDSFEKSKQKFITKISNPQLTEIELNILIDEINCAKNNLVNISLLRDMITRAKNIKITDYTNASTNAMQQVLTQSQIILEKENATLNEVNLAIDNIKVAISKLEKLKDKKELIQGILLAEQLLETAKKEKVFDDLIIVKNNCEKLLNNNKISDIEINNNVVILYNNINKVKNYNSEYELAKENLQQKIINLNTLEKTHYTINTWNNLIKEKEKATAVLVSTESLTKDILLSINNLDKSEDSLIRTHAHINILAFLSIIVLIVSVGLAVILNKRYKRLIAKE